jgi:hypothetical protein
MFILELLIAISISLVLSALFFLVTQRGERRTGFFWLFVIVFLATWAGGVWLRPFGPTIWGVYWLGFLLAGLFILLLLAIFIPRQPVRGRRETLDMLEKVARKRELDTFTYITLGVFFWILLAALIIAIMFRYLL